MKYEYWLRRTALATGALFVIGCGDDPAAPVAPDARGVITLAAGTTGTTVFTVNPNGGKFDLAGGHKISFEGGAICDPLTSGYGPTMWDAPCTPTRLPITITATSWTDANGNPRVDFTPDLRFVPRGSVGSAVLLQMRDSRPNATAIFYCPTIGECFDESVTDPAAKSQRDGNSNFIFRYIKHFSGYNVSTGRAVEVSDDMAGAELF